MVTKTLFWLPKRDLVTKTSLVIILVTISTLVTKMILVTKNAQRFLLFSIGSWQRKPKNAQGLLLLLQLPDVCQNRLQDLVTGNWFWSPKSGFGHQNHVSATKMVTKTRFLVTTEFLVTKVISGYHFGDQI